MNLNVSLAPNVLFHIGSFAVTNTYFWTVFIVLFLIFIFGKVGSNLKMVPGKFQNFVEIIVDGAYSFIKSIVKTDEKTKRMFPLVFTMFIFILFANLIPYLPGQAAISVKTAGGVVPLFRAIMSDYSLVLAMTLVSVITMQIVAIAINGPLRYIGKFINFKNPLKFFLGIMDLISEFAKVISLSFRLFGNIFAGEVLSSVILFLAPFFMPIPFTLLGILSGVVQAFVFAVLTLIFVDMASEVEGEKA